MSLITRMMALGTLLCVAGGLTAQGQDFPSKDVFTFLEKHLPDHAAELEDLRTSDPEQFEVELEEVAEFVDYLTELEEENSRAFDVLIRAERLEMESWKVVGDISETSDPTRKEELRASLQSMLEEIFEARMEEQEFEIRALAEELEEIQSIMERRRRHKDEIIRRHMDRLLSEEEDLGWW